MKNCVQGFPECTRIGGWFGYQIGQKWGFGFGNEGSDWITLCSEFFAVKGRLPATPTSLKSTAFPFGLENFGVNPWSVGSLDNYFGFNWGMDVENGSEGGGKLICKVGCIGSWLCVERGSKNVIFEVVNINGIVGAVLDGCSFGCRADAREEFECERFVIRLVGFVLRKVCDNSRAGSSNEKIKGMTIIMSWKVDVLSEMEIIKDARKIVRGS